MSKSSVITSSHLSSLTLLALITFGASGCATFSVPDEPQENAGEFGPRHFGHSHSPDPGPESAAEGLIAFYQRNMRAPTLPDYGCPFHPSCSEYGRQAYHRYGLVGGTVLTIDRLLIRSHLYADDYYPIHCDDDRCPRRYDPVP
ncbi:MAG: membrane protein insertion efficiency factor YidD [Myxococcota bacterium]